MVPLRLTAKQQLAPVADLARVSKDDPRYFTGSLWLMATGSWKVRVDVDGRAAKARSPCPCRRFPRACLECKRRWERC